MSNHNDLERALEPASQKKSPVKYLVLIVIAVLIIAVGYWLAKQFLLKGEVEIPLPKEMAQAVSENLRLEDGKLGPVRITPNEPAQPSGPAALPQAPAGQWQGSGAAPGLEAERPSASGIIAEPGRDAVVLAPPQEAGEPRRKIYSGADAVVTMGFVNDLAEYLAANFWPQSTHADARDADISSAGLSSAGQRYGLELTGFASTRAEAQRDYLRDRALVLNYVYTPSMVEALTRLYADRFADALAEAGFRQVRGGAPMTQEQVAGMLRFYARYARSAGAALAAYNAEENAPRLVQRYTDARETVFAANMRFHDAQYNLDNAREAKKSGELRAAQQEMRTAEQEFRKAMLEQERAREGVLAFMGKGASRRLDDHELLYIAAWAARRGPNAGAAHLAASASAEYLAGVLDEKALALE